MTDFMLPVVPGSASGRPGSGGGRPPNSGGLFTPTVPKGGRPRRGRPSVEPQQRSSTAATGVSVKYAPIWLGSSTNGQKVTVRDIKNIVPQDLHFNESVLAIERFEAEAGPFEAQRKYIMAAECLEQAINLRRKFLGDTHRDFLAGLESYVVSCNLWGIQCLSSAQYTCSLELLKKAEYMTEADNVPNFTRRVALRAATFNNLCCYYRHRGKLNAALQFAERALKIEQRFKDAESPARTHLNYAVLLSMMGRHEEAIEHIESAVAILHDEECQISYELGEGGLGIAEGLPAKADGSRERQQECVSALVVAYYNMWVELSRLSRKEAGMDWVGRAANIAQRKLGTAHPLTVKMEDILAAAREQSARSPGGLPLALQQQPPQQQQQQQQSLDVTVPLGPAAVFADTSATTLPAASPQPHVAWASSPSPAPGATQGGADARPPTDLQSILATSTKESPVLLPLKKDMVSKMAFKRDFMQLRLKESVYGVRGGPPEPHPQMAEPFFKNRPRQEATPGYAGCPALQQLAHGVKPRLKSLTTGGRRSQSASPALGESGGAGGAGTATATVDGVAGGTAAGGGSAEGGARSLAGSPPGGAAVRPLGPLAPVAGPTAPETKAAQADLPVSPHLRAAYEYYEKQAQLRENTVVEEAEASADVERIHAIGVFRARLEQRRGKGLPAPSDSNRSRAATKIQALFRGYITRRWDTRELARQQRKEHLAPLCRSGDGRSSSAPVGPSDMKRRIAFRVIYAARRAFVEYSAALKVQKTWRGWVTRRDIRQQVDEVACVTATRLQALFRRSSAVSRCYRRMDAAEAIQGASRRRLGRRRATRVRGFVRLLTRIALGYTTRRRLARLDAAAAGMQRLARGFVARRRLLHRHEGALAFQKVFRASLVRIFVRKQRRAIIRVQALFRGYKERRLAGLLVEASCLVQRQFRFWRRRREHNQKTAIALKISANWKGREMRKVKPYYKSACKMQARARGLLVRKRMRGLNPAALRIQAYWRGSMARHRTHVRLVLAVTLQKMTGRRLALRRLRQAEDATIVCQRRIRGSRARWALRHRLHRSAQRLQAWWRSMLARLELLRMGRAAQRIQTLVRRTFLAFRFKARREAVSRLRAGWLAYVLRQRHRREQAAVLCLSPVCRGFLVRARFRRRRAAARQLQRYWRGHCVRSVQRRRKLAVQRIQAALRCRWQWDRYYATRTLVAVILQARWRKRLARRRFLRQRRAVVLLQSAARGRNSRGQLKVMRLAAADIQCEWRRRRVRLRAVLATRSASRLQVCWRAVLDRRLVERQEAAAVAIQKVMQALYTVKRVQARRRAVLTISTFVKASLQWRRYSTMRRKAIYIQAFCRGRRLRERLRKAHALIGMLKSRWVYKKQLRSVVFMQRVFRRIRNSIGQKLKSLSAKRVQTLMRGFLTRRHISRSRKAARTIQSWLRGRWLRKRFLARRFVQVKLCSVWRQRRIRVMVVNQITLPVSKIRAVMKSHVVRLHIARMHFAARVIQRHSRGILERRRLSQRRKVIRLQCLGRRFLARRTVEGRRHRVQLAECREEGARARRLERRCEKAAVIIQSHVRRSQRQPKFKLQCAAAARIQNGWLLSRAPRRRARRATAAIVIQSHVRRVAAAKWMALQKTAVTRLQKAVRFFLVRHARRRRIFNAFADKAMAATCIQTKWRQHFCVWRHMRRCVAAVRIEASCRMFLTRRSWQAKRNAALRIQVGLIKPRRCIVKILRERRNLVIKFQSCARVILAKRRTRQMRAASCLLQAAARSWFVRRCVVARRDVFATRLQAHWRMYYQKNIAHMRRMHALRQIQSSGRRFASILMMKVRFAAAQRIQNNVRIRRCQRRMQKMRWLAVALQRIWRARQARAIWGVSFRRLCRVPGHVRGYRERFKIRTVRNAAATVIQRTFRGRGERARLQRRHKAIAVVQAWWRCFAARRHWQRCLGAVRTIQGATYHWHHRRKVRAMKLLYEQCSSAASSQVPRMQHEKTKDGALRVSRLYRGHHARRLLQRREATAKRLQDLARVFLAQRKLRRRLVAVLRTQPALSGAVRRRRLRNSLALVRMLQVHVKMWAAVRRFAATHAAVLHIQRCVRGAAARRRLQKRESAKRRAEHAVRCWLTRRRFKRQQQASLCIQVRWRGFLVREGVRELKRCTTSIQAAWRMHHCYQRHQRVRHAGAILVSGVIMCRHVRLYRQKLAAIRAISTAWRRLKFVRAVRRKSQAAEKLQKWWRNLNQELDYRDLVQQVLGTAKVMRKIYNSYFAVKIQRWFRVQRLRPFPATRCTRGIVRLQAHARRHLAQREAELRRLVLGVRVDRYLARRVLLAKDKRGWLSHHHPADGATGPELRGGQQLRPGEALIVDVVALTQRQRKELEVASVAKLQPFARWCRFLRATRKLQGFCRGRACRQALRRKRDATVLLQALFRPILALRRVRAWKASREAALTALEQRKRARAGTSRPNLATWSPGGEALAFAGAQ